jgi:hypothetical protein
MFSLRTGLIGLFSVILAAMLWQTATASMAQALWAIPDQVTQNPWFVATLYDAYCGFITIFVWIAFREKAFSIKVFWFILLMLLGNIAISAYCLLVLLKAKPEAHWKTWLMGPEEENNPETEQHKDCPAH